MKPWMIVGLVVLLLGGGGYVLWSRFSTNTGAGLSLGGTKLNPNCEENDPDLCKFLNANAAATEELTLDAVTTGGDTASSTMHMEIEGDRTRLTVSESNKETMDQITIGNTYYGEDYTDSTWWKYESKTEAELEDAPITAEDVDASERLTENKATYEAKGKEPCGTYTCFKYRVITPGLDDEEHIFFDDKQYKLRKITSLSANGMLTETTYSYDKLSISAPTLTKEASSFLEIYGAGSAGASLPTTSTESETSASSPSADDLQQLIDSAEESLGTEIIEEVSE